MNSLYTIILNPTAGKGKAQKKISHITSFLQRHNIQYRMLLTEYPGHAKELSRDCAQNGRCRIIAAGGDGTCNEVANGLLSAASKEPPLMGVLPIGSGNDFSYGSALPMDLDGSLHLITSRNTKTIDAGVLNVDGKKQVFFINGMGIGFDARVSIEAGKMKHLKGALGYLYGALKMLLLFPPPPDAVVSLDSETLQVRADLICCMLGKRLGGSFLMAPRGDNQDELFDLYITQQDRRLKMLRDFLYYKKGEQDKLDDTRFFRSRKVAVTSPTGGLAVHADGENVSIDARTIEASCLPAALRVLC